MNNEQRDTLLQEIHTDVKVVASQYEAQEKQISELFTRTKAAEKTVTQLEKTQELCPGRIAAQPQTVAGKLANKLMLFSVILIGILGLLNLGITIWGYRNQMKLSAEAQKPAGHAAVSTNKGVEE